MSTVNEELETSLQDEFLAFRQYEILPDHSKGLISHEQAKKKAESEYLEFNKTQKIVSDFDKEVKQIIEGK